MMTFMETLIYTTLLVIESQHSRIVIIEELTGEIVDETDTDDDMREAAAS